ncbi:ABC transporter ATP-binding protein [Pseudomonas asiatica]|uniref:ABC transporter ATP-binding protein n=1 Tax=Gammaproteobacteria TaxID=1236 RepID=UPI001BAE8053|nr:ABC transporter ATP-binding protein [Pseudomonas asiatica]BDG78261.1 ABC transporter ATP-binding protein [Stenotrophomonas maltophilia]HDS1229895.1 ABC transporter ATP-binding protein [Stenotrophomonas maltophilia]
MSAHPLGQLWIRYRQYRPRVVLALVLSTIRKIMDVVPELLIGAAIDVVVRGSDSFVATLLGVPDRRDQLIWLAVINAVVWVLESTFDYLSSITWRNLAQQVEHDLRLEAYGHVQGLDMAWHEGHPTGSTLAVVNDDVNQLERFLDTGVDKLWTLALNIVLVGAVFAASSWTLTLLAFLPIPVIVVGSLWFQQRLQPRYTVVRHAVARISSLVSANLGGMATIKSFTAEERELERVREASEDYRLANQHAIAVSAAFVPLIRMAILAGFTTTLLLGGWMALDGRLEVGLYSVLVFMTQRLLWPLTSVGEVLDLYQRAMASVRRILTLLDERPVTLPGERVLPAVEGRLELQGVRAGYDDGPDVLHELTMTVPAGEVHAIVGPTGAGKSTLLRLLLRFADPREGQVLLDGVDLRELTWEALRGRVGYVAQDTFLFEGTVADNIAYGRPEASREEIETAARQAEASSFIEAMTQGYDTHVGERGVTLSGGQRQRLALARAILRDPAVLILDEATSAVDNETEAAIQRSLAEVSQGRTTVMVAHRLSTVRHADRIWVLEAGRVVDAGTHDELVARLGPYADLWAVQTGDLGAGAADAAARHTG